MSRLKFHRRIVGGMSCDVCHSTVSEVCHECSDIVCEPCHGKRRRHKPYTRNVTYKARNRTDIQVRHVGMDQCRYAQGIHLTGPLAPGGEERALERAERDLFRDIWIHWPNVVALAHYVSKREAAV